MLRPLMASSQSSWEPPPPNSPTRPITKPRKVSAACLACKQRKTKCSGNNPCDQCAARHSRCVYDLAADQRRKIANQRNIQELAQKGEDIERLCVVLGGILATIRAGNPETLEDLTATIRSVSGLPDLSFYVNGLMATWPDIYLEFQTIDFYLDDAPRRPSVEAIEAEDMLSSPTGTGMVPEGVMEEQEVPRHGAKHQRLQSDESSTDQSVIEPFSSTENMNTRQPTRGSTVDATTDVPSDFHRHRASDSVSDSGSGRCGRTARPWELP